MYFHCPHKGNQNQLTHVAVSHDGIHFNMTLTNEALGIFYFRLFQYKHWWYAVAKGGLLYRSKDGLTGFQEGSNIFPGGETRYPLFNSPGPRHVALHIVEDFMWVYYSNIGDSPERIFRVYVSLNDDWDKWKVSSNPELILSPSTSWEGANLPILSSKFGASKGLENAVRDPAVFVDKEGQVYLLYTVAGEAGIAIAEIMSFNNVTT